jgi:rhamnosyltransferase
MENIKRAEILMSTYNGAKHLEEQIESIFSQVDVDVHLSIRDDGSKDTTVDVIRKLSEKHPGKISLHVGENIGYGKSFLRLLNLAEEAEYYGFSDQDDYWKPDKLRIAIERIQTLDSDIKLYVSSTENVNEKMEMVGIHDMSKVIPTLESAFTRNRYTGCTFLFNRALKNIATRFSELEAPQETMPAHDFVLVVCALACGQIYYDSESYIYHIRREESVTTGGNGIHKRIRAELNGIFHRKHMSSYTARIMLERCKDELTDEAKKFLMDVSSCNDSFKNRINLITNSEMKSGLLLCDCECKFKILIGQY